jgi:hypothetical protein
MTVDDWRRQIEEVVRQISDRHYQQESWFGGGRQVSSPDELYCSLFDDALFERFLDENRRMLTERQLAAGNLLKTKMEEYQLPEFADPAEVIDSPEWEAIRSAAREFLLALENVERRA